MEVGKEERKEKGKKAGCEEVRVGRKERKRGVKRRNEGGENEQEGRRKVWGRKRKR